MAAIPKPAATLVLIDGDDPATGRVLMGIRNHNLAFMPGAAVFPGGRLEAGESPLDAALRELTEETGLVLDELQPLKAPIAVGRAVTPAFSPKRYDTLFYAARIANPLPPSRGDAELEQLGWYSNAEIDQLPTMGITRRGLMAARNALADPENAEIIALNREDHQKT